MVIHHRHCHMKQNDFFRERLLEYLFESIREQRMHGLSIRLIKINNKKRNNGLCQLVYPRQKTWYQR